MVSMIDLRVLGACANGRAFASSFVKDAATQTIGIDAKDVRRLRTAIKRVHANQLKKYSASGYSESFVTERAERRVGTYLGKKWSHLAWYLGRVCTDSELRYQHTQYEMYLMQLCRLVGIPEEGCAFAQNLALRIMNCTGEEAIAIAAALNLWLNGLPQPNALLRRTRG